MDGAVPDIRREVMRARDIVSEFEYSVMSAQTMVNDIRRAAVESQGGSGGKNQLVRDTRT
jgi:hypothetical protein